VTKFVEGGDGIGIGEHETGFVGMFGAVPGPLLDKLGARLALGAGPVDRTLTGLKQRFGESRVDLMAYGRTPWS
jgi:hypothetical protein